MKRLLGKPKGSTSPLASKGRSSPISANNSDNVHNHLREVDENQLHPAYLQSSSSNASLPSIAEDKNKKKNKEGHSITDLDAKMYKLTPTKEPVTVLLPNDTTTDEENHHKAHISHSSPDPSDEPHASLVDHDRLVARQEANNNGWLPFYNFFAPIFCMVPVTESFIDDNDSVVEDENSVYRSRKLNSITFLGETKFHMMVDEAIDRAKVYLGLKKSDLPFKWKLKSNTNGIEVYSCNLPNDTACVVRSHFKIDCSISTMKELLLDEKYFPTLDPSLEMFEVGSLIICVLVIV